MIELSEIYMYPVKGCRAVPLQRAEVTRRGLAGDRRYMVVDGGDAYLTQREFPRLALIQPEIGNEGLNLSAPGMPSLPTPRPGSGRTMDVQVWNDRVSAVHVSDEADEWLSSFLETSCRLVYMPDTSIRPVEAEYSRSGDHVSFADAYPLLLLSHEAVAELNRRKETTVPMSRFRPNLVMRGTTPFEEDGWPALTVGNVKFRSPKPCARCVVVTVDQDTGARESRGETLRALAGFRTVGQKVIFGQNLIPEREGWVAVGERIAMSNEQ